MVLKDLIIQDLPLQLFIGDFEEVQFKPIKNFEGMAPHNKPESGGIWTSTYLESRGSQWLDFVIKSKLYSHQFLANRKREFPKYGTIFQVKEGAKILKMDSQMDLQRITKGFLKRYILSYSEDSNEILNFLDFESLAKNFDALHFTEKGIEENKDYSMQPNLMGYDIECTLWFNLNYLTPINKILLNISVLD